MILRVGDAADLRDPAYDGKTFGVVVLQGQSQVDLINDEIGSRMSAGDWEKRRFRVGTPPDFQGDERNVVWLSLVVAPEQNFMALTRDEFRRRFNVAASRAQDQLWLFHSVTVDRLRDGDLRRSLLTYMLSTGAAPLPPAPTDVPADIRDPRFDSLFEQRVFLDITARGYHVIPQVETNGRRIDLVVTGAGGKLAVECDGDAFHTTPEQRAADLNREQELKRCGWTFWRVRESQYYLDRERALSSLWPTLDRLRIGPHAGTVEQEQALTWQPTRSVPDSAAVEPEPSVPVHVVPDPVEPAATVRAAAPVRTPRRSDLTHYELTRSVVRLAGSGPLTPAQVAEDYGMTTADARDVLGRMVTAGLLSRTGEGRGTQYVPPTATAATVRKTQTQPGTPSRRPPAGAGTQSPRSQSTELPAGLQDPQLRRVWRMTEGRSINNVDVRDALGVDANRAQDLLRALYERELLDRHGPRGQRRYSRRERQGRRPAPALATVKPTDTRTPPSLQPRRQR